MENRKSFVMILGPTATPADGGSVVLVPRYDRDDHMEGIVLLLRDENGRQFAEVMLDAFEARRLGVALIDRVAEPEVLP